MCAGIGDGGNELGMGKVKAAVKAYMPNGNLIACDVAADFAITAGKHISHRDHILPGEPWVEREVQLPPLWM